MNEISFGCVVNFSLKYFRRLNAILYWSPIKPFFWSQRAHTVSPPVIMCIYLLLDGSFMIVSHNLNPKTMEPLKSNCHFVDTFVCVSVCVQIKPRIQWNYKVFSRPIKNH